MHTDIEQVQDESLEKQFQTIYEIISLVNRPADLPSNLSRALDIARDALGTHILILSLVDGDGQLSYTAWSCAPEIEKKVLAHCTSGADESLQRQAVETRQVVRVFDATDEAEPLSQAQREAYRRLKARRLAYEPLVSKGQVLGVVTLMRHNSPEIGPKKIAFLQKIKELLVMLIENARLQSQIRELSIIKERQRLAHELHDSVTQSLFTLSLAAQGLKATLQHTPGPHQQAVDLLIDQTEAVQQDMRSLIEELRPVDLQAQRFKPELRRHVKSLERTTGIDVDLKIEGDVRSLPRSVQGHFNRIAQEAMSNIAQHAAAQQVKVELEVSSDYATLAISDDGVGFDLQRVSMRENGSLGLLSMRERAEMMGGALLVRTAPEQGTTITARVPMQEKG